MESGSRRLIEKLLPVLRRNFGDVPVDLVTCFDGAPEGTSAVFRVADYRGRRRDLHRELARRKYAVAGILCSDEPVLTKWKWVLAARVPAKIFITNENADYFWLDYSSWRTVRHFIAIRAGLTGAGAVRTMAQLLLFPFAVGYLLLYASAVHLRRALRSALS